jgi:hypothetical protein
VYIILCRLIFNCKLIRSDALIGRLFESSASAIGEQCAQTGNDRDQTSLCRAASEDEIQQHFQFATRNSATAAITTDKVSCDCTVSVFRLVS